MKRLGWIEHDGTNQSPVDLGEYLDVKFSGGRRETYIQAGFVDWSKATHYRPAVVRVNLKRIPVRGPVDMDAIYRRGPVHAV